MIASSLLCPDHHHHHHHQDFSRQMLEAIQFLHSMSLVHTDLKPENVLLVSREFTTQQVGNKKVRIPKSTAIKLIDFGCATYDDDEHKSDVIATRQYRAPEVILGLPWSYPSDIWSVGCIVAELYCGDQYFETHSNMEHIALIERGVGKWPKSQMSVWFPSSVDWPQQSKMKNVCPSSLPLLCE